MPSRWYDIRVVRDKTKVAESSQILNLDDAEATRALLLGLLAGSVRRDVGEQRLTEVWRYGLEIRLQNRRSQVMPIFRATFDQVRGL
jgi:hypothetical protein